jgi:hypothetical protein
MSAKSQASTAATTSQNTSNGLGAQGSTISSSLVPFESRQLQNPAGYSQQDVSSMLTAGLAGAGGATAGLAGAASQNAATSRNPNGFSAALDAASMNRAKAAASTSEGIAANNANVKLQQQQQAAGTLAGMYGTDVSGQNAASGQIAADSQAETAATRQTFNDISSGISDVGDIKGMFPS